MKVTIERSALDTALRAVLGCIAAPQYVDVGKAYMALGDEEIVDYMPLIELAEHDGKYGPFHMLLEFSSYGQDNLDEFTITQNDVLRLFCTKYHFDFIADNVVNPMVVSDTASFLVNHMALPMTITKADDVYVGEYVHNGHTMTVSPISVPPGVHIEEGVKYAVHMSSVITALTDAQAAMIEAELALSDRFEFLADQVDEADFTDFQHFGNYTEKIAERNMKVFG